MDRTTSQSRIQDRGLPAGVEVRRFAGPQDYAPMAEVYAACARVDGLDEAVTAEDLAHFIESPVGLDPAQDVFVVEGGGRVVGYGWVNHKLEGAGDETHQLRGYVHPAWRRAGLGSALVDRMEARAQQRGFPLTATGSRFVQSHVLDTELPAHDLFRSRGYAPARYAFRMERDLSQPIPVLPLPDGIRVRVSTEADYRAVWEAEREAFQDHWGYTPWPEEHFQRFRTFPHYDLSLWRVAWAGDLVAGMVLNYINEEENAAKRRRLGYTEDIAVRRPWRRQGLASALIALSLQALRQRGMTQAALAVDAENPTGALRVYERLGYRAVNRWTLYRRLLDRE
jgi:mycothiol synthase